MLGTKPTSGAPPARAGAWLPCGRGFNRCRLGNRDPGRLRPDGGRWRRIGLIDPLRRSAMLVGRTEITDPYMGQPRVGFELPEIEPLKDEEGNVVTDEETGAPKFPPKEGEEGYVPPTALRDEETGEPLLDDDGNFNDDDGNDDKVVSSILLVRDHPKKESGKKTNSDFSKVS